MTTAYLWLLGGSFAVLFLGVGVHAYSAGRRAHRSLGLLAQGLPRYEPRAVSWPVAPCPRCGVRAYVLPHGYGEHTDPYDGLPCGGAR